jgi:DNA (cytosine-5)-methyltransferase 1
LASGSLAHGGGVLAHAIHKGLRDAGVECEMRFANELRDDLLLQAAQHNDTWHADTAAMALPMQEAVQDDWLMARLPKLEVLEVGIPCSGASVPGRTRRGLEMAEAHPEVGHLVFAALMIILRTQPAICLIENVPAYANTASAQILRLQFRDMGYDTHEAMLSGKDFGCLEDRTRWCMVAVTRGVEFSFEALVPAVTLVRTVGEILDPAIAPDDPRWREVAYLFRKEERNAAVGDRFKMQFVDAASTGVPTMRRGYFKGGSSDPRVRHPSDPAKSRLFTAGEHAAVKGVPPALIEGLAETTAHQLLGQGIVYEPFRAVGQRLGECLRRLASDWAADGQVPEASATVSRRQRMTG